MITRAVSMDARLPSGDTLLLRNSPYRRYDDQVATQFMIHYNLTHGFRIEAFGNDGAFILEITTIRRK